MLALDFLSRATKVVELIGEENILRINFIEGISSYRILLTDGDYVAEKYGIHEVNEYDEYTEFITLIEGISLVHMVNKENPAHSLKLTYEGHLDEFGKLINKGELHFHDNTLRKIIHHENLVRYVDEVLKEVLLTYIYEGDDLIKYILKEKMLEAFNIDEVMFK